MFDDLRSLPRDTTVRADLCIVGAGPAGILLAREFASRAVDVCLVESGARDFDRATQALYDIESVGLDIGPSAATRLRFFGGTTNHWDGRCSPFDHEDFEARAWVPHSGWPISRASLIPFYERAQRLTGLAPSFLDDDDVVEMLRTPRPPLDTQRFRLRTWRYSPPTRFGAEYAPELDRAPRVRVILNANVTDFSFSGGERAARVTSATLRSLDGNTARVEARHFVLCCGAIENARILLHAAATSSRAATVWNRHDLVGRYYMEHIRWRGAVELVRDRYALQRTFNAYHQGGHRYLIGMGLQPSVQASRRILNSAGLTFHNAPTPSSWDATRTLLQGAARLQAPPAIRENTRAVLRNLDEVISNLRRKVLVPNAEPLIRGGATWFFCELEQAPNPDSRITLGESRDALGLRRARVDWRFTPLDHRSMQEAVRAYGAELARTLGARLQVPDWMSADLETWSRQFRGVAHHIGTTRMAADPRQGVVDANLRVHGIENFHITGSSVFPTSAQANPTLTLLALTLRLADHLNSRLRLERT